MMMGWVAQTLLVQVGVGWCRPHWRGKELGGVGPVSTGWGWAVKTPLAWQQVGWCRLHWHGEGLGGVGSIGTALGLGIWGVHVTTVAHPVSQSG